MIQRCTDAAEIMAMVDHPRVKPWLPPLTMEKMESYLSDPRTLAFTGGGAGAVFEWSAPGVYEAHLFFVPPCTGKSAIAAARSISSIMISEYDARMLWGEVKLTNRHTRWFSRAVGFRSLGVETRSGEPHELFVMEAGYVS